MENKKKICFVIQRYGLEINGGAETYCRELAERLLDRYDVSVFTTCAIDYMTWANQYPAGPCEINGVKVYRFPVDNPRRQEVFDEVNGRFLRGEICSNAEEDGWFVAQGPYSLALLEALRQAHDRYDVFLMCTYLYFQTACGTELVRDKAILIPMTHDEPYLQMRRIRRLFHQPRAFLFLTEEERDLVYQKFGVNGTPAAVGGAGVDLPADVNAARFMAKYGLENVPYIVYVGRIDAGKNCDVMFRYWQAYKERNPGPLRLVLMGKPVIPVPQREDILSLGFVSEQDKFDGVAGAKFLLLPSRFESLSIVVLEAMSLKVPVLVDGDCAVLKGHCVKSNAGLYYQSYLEFEGAVNLLLKNEPLRAALGQNGPDYVEQEYRWDVILDKVSGLIEKVSEGEDKQ